MAVGEEIFQFEDAARRRHVFVGGDAADRQFMHGDRVGDGLEIERAQMLDAVHQKGVLLAHDFAGDFEDGLGALVEALDQPGGIGLAFGEIGLVFFARGVLARPARRYWLLTSTRGSVSLFSSTSQVPSGAARTKTSGTTGWTGSAIRRRGRAWD